MVKEKGDLDKITVTELVRRANINRSTFYLHYSDIYDIAAEMEQSLMSDVMQNSPIAILTSESPMYFLRKLRREIAVKIQSIPDVNHNPTPWFQMNTEIFADGICEQVVYYFRGRTEYTFEELKLVLLYPSALFWLSLSAS